jgi:hypothetical protein
MEGSIMTASSVEFSFEYCGEKYQCFYAIEGNPPAVIRVSTPWGPRSGELGNGYPLVVARLMAAEVAQDARMH